MDPIRLYRWALRLLPGPVRDRFADEMQATFEAEWRAAAPGATSVHKVLFVARALTGVAHLAIEARMDRPQTRANPLSGLWGDLRRAARSLAREPTFSLTVVVALGLGVGLTASSYSIVRGTILRGLPFERPQELVHFERGDAESESLPVTPHDLVDWRAANRSFVDLAGYTEAVVNLTAPDRPSERVYGSYIEARAFGLLGVEPAVGRLLSESDERDGAPPVVLLGDRVWQRWFERDPGIVGRSLRINDEPHVVVGVMPPGFAFPLSEEMWLPLRLDLASIARGEGRLDAVGRLRLGLGLDEARADFARVSTGLAEAYPASNAGIRAVLRAYVDEYVDDDFASMVWTLLIAASLVLLLASFNVASLLLARGTTRAGELAVRVSLGAGRWRVARHLASEAVLLAGASAVVGAALAWVGVGWFAGRGARPGTFQLAHGGDVPFWWDVRLDGASLIFVLAVSGVAVAGAGLLPILRGLRANPNQLLRSDTRGASARTGAIARAVVVLQMALAVGVLSVAGLMGRSVLQLSDVGRGLETSGIAVGSVALPDARLGADEGRFADRESRRRFWSDLRRALAEDPEVEVAAIGTAVPFLRVAHAPFALPDDEADPDGPRDVATAFVEPAWFTMLGVTPLEGRLLADSDRGGSEPVAVVNASFRDRWLDGSAVGRVVRLPGPTGALQLARVVGVVPDLWVDGIRDEEPEGVYRPFAQAGAPNRSGIFDRRELRYAQVLVRGIEGASVHAALRRAVDRLAPGVPVYGLSTVDDTLRRVGGEYRLYGMYYLVFGAVSLFMVLVGVYGLVAYSVGQRRREIGIRVALGCRGPEVVAMVVRRALNLVVVGLGLGWVVALWMQSSLSLVLYRVEPGDPWVVPAVLALLFSTGAVAALIPALRAGRVEPSEAMRRD